MPPLPPPPPPACASSPGMLFTAAVNPFFRALTAALTFFLEGMDSRLCWL